MNPFERIPLLRFFIPLLCGIIFSIKIELNVFIISSLYILLILLFFAESFFYRKNDEKKHYRFRWLSGALLSSVLFLSGMLLVINNDIQKHPGHFSRYNYMGNYVITRLEENLSERKSSYRALMNVVAVKEGNIWVKTKGKVLQYFEKDSIADKLSYGDCILQKANFTKVVPPRNPNEFNYSKYLAQNGIYHQAYLKTDYWKLTQKDTGNKLFKFTFKAKDFILEKLKDTGIGSDDLALISALLLGMSDNLDADTLKKFSAAGTMHILCVSGLHVGIFFVLLNFLLSFLDKKRSGRFIKALLIILSIWFYALLTGLAPSVLRASTMFSVIVVAKLINKHSCIYNTLLFSAILLLIFDPLIVTKLGFWLSYMAVLGIVYLFPKFYELFKFKNWLADKIWMLACVSLAAQIATSPLSVYYFNQFPNYFLISNIIVVPLATIIVYTSLGLLLFSFIPYLSSAVVYILSFFLNSLQYVVSFIEALPYSTSVMIINNIQLWVLYLFILFLILFFEKIKPIFLKLSLLCLLIIFSIAGINNFKNKTEKKLTLYSIDKSFALELKTGNNAVFIADSTLLKKQDLLNYHVKTNQLKSGIKKIIEIPLEMIELYDSLYNFNTYLIKNYVCFGNKKFLILNNKKYYTDNTNRNFENSIEADLYEDDYMNGKRYLNEYFLNNYSNSTNIKYATDYLILSQLNKANRENLLQIFKTDFFIINTTLKNKDKDLFYKHYTNNIKNIVDLKKEGAFILKMEP